MRCVFIVKPGKRCRRQAEPDLPLCPYHRALDEERRSREEEQRAFYADLESTQAQTELAEAAQPKGLSTEIAVLRVLIRKKASRGDLDGARRAIQVLLRVLQSPQALAEPGKEIPSWLERALDDLGGEPP